MEEEEEEEEEVAVGKGEVEVMGVMEMTRSAEGGPGFADHVRSHPIQVTGLEEEEEEEEVAVEDQEEEVAVAQEEVAVAQDEDVDEAHPAAEPAAAATCEPADMEVAIRQELPPCRLAGPGCPYDLMSKVSMTVTRLTELCSGASEQPMVELQQQEGASAQQVSSIFVETKVISGSSSDSVSLPLQLDAPPHRSVEVGTLTLSSAAPAAPKGARCSKVPKAAKIHHVKSVVVRKVVIMRISEPLRDLLLRAAEGEVGAWDALLLLFPSDMFRELNSYETARRSQTVVATTTTTTSATGEFVLPAAQVSGPVQPMLGWHVECLPGNLDHVRLVTYLPWNGPSSEILARHPLLA